MDAQPEVIVVSYSPQDIGGELRTKLQILDGASGRVLVPPLDE